MIALSLAPVLALTAARHAAGQFPSTGGQPLFPISYPAGWNIVAVTRPRLPFFGVAYALQVGDSDYEVIPLAAMLQPRVGYWIYFSHDFSHDGHIFVNSVSSCEITIPVPGGGRCGLANPNIPVPAGQWAMIGNPLSQPITVTGADAMYIYDPTAGSYMATTTLQVGQGAFVYSTNGGAVTIAPVGS